MHELLLMLGMEDAPESLHFYIDKHARVLRAEAETLTVDQQRQILRALENIQTQKRLSDDVVMLMARLRDLELERQTKS